jgi:fructoselysine-6-P-deglycase FrlB-like protein
MKNKLLSTVDAFEKEIMLQLDFIKNFVPQKPLAKRTQKDTIFCGTGDSFVSALLAEAFSDFRARALDPLDLLKNQKLAQNKNLYLVSISGNTVSNIKLAKISKNTTSITSNPQSRLADSCKKLILLQYPNSGIFTAGSISFLASALTCITLVTKLEIRKAPRLFDIAKSQSRKVRLGGKIYLLGNFHTFPIAMFGAAKLYEIGGIDAHYERIEQFSHTGLFSAKKGDTVIIFEEKNKHNSKLASSLKKYGLHVIQFSPHTKNIQEIILFFIFVSELVALYHAKKKNQKDCFFVTDKNLRETSSSMIY